MNRQVAESAAIEDAASAEALSAPSSGLRSWSDRFPSASKGLLSIFDQALVSGTSFVTAAIVGRLTSPDELGLYYLVLSVTLIISSIQDQLIGGPYMVLSKRRHGRSLAEYGGSYWVHQLGLTVVMVAVLVAVISISLATGRTTILPGLWALLVAGPLVLLRDGIRRFTFAHLRVVAAVVLDAVAAVVQLGGLLLLAYAGRLTLLNIFGVMSIACALACVGWYLLDQPQLGFNRRRFAVDWRHNWTFGRWGLCSYILTGTTTQLMIWILGIGLDTSAAAVFGACTTLVGMTNVLVNGVSNLLTPLAAREYANGGARELRRILYRTAATLAIVLGSFSLFILATGDWLVVLVFGRDYHGTGLILFTLALGVVMNGQVLVAGNGLWAIGQPRSVFFADVWGMLVTLILVVALIEPLGVLGAALAILGGNAAAAIARTAILVRYLLEEQANARISVDPSLCVEGA